MTWQARLVVKAKRWALRLAKWLTAWAERTPDDVSNAVKGAFTDCGLPLAQFRPEFDLYQSGKLHEVLYHTARRLDRDHVMRTVEDVIAAFEDHR